MKLLKIKISLNNFQVPAKTRRPSLLMYGPYLVFGPLRELGVPQGHSNGISRLTHFPHLSTTVSRS